MNRFTFHGFWQNSTLFKRQLIPLNNPPKLEKVQGEQTLNF